MRKIAILTHYHNTTNYGGALQAYALCSVINLMGYKCEQIDTNCFAECISLYEKPSKLKKILRPFKPIYYFVLKFDCRKKARVFRKYRKAFKKFITIEIPHSKRQYNKRNISKCVKDYDVFIVGSDQVWNPIWYFPPFFLDFVSSNVPKISYAASISQTNFSTYIESVYREHLKDFQAISVRERDNIELLANIVQVNVEHVLDPTLLLTQEEWNKITSERIIEQPYIFCYFLGNDNNMRSIVVEYAKTKDMLLVNMKHASARYHDADLVFGDMKVEAPTPNDFLSLIKYADYVFTDSFHATVFSLIFQKQFYVFERTGFKGMGTRIKSLVALFDVESRFLNSCETATLEHITNMQKLDYSEQCELYNVMKNKSINFLKSNLMEAEKRVKCNEDKSA